MITLSQAVDLWFGEASDRPRRALFLGAGFAKGCAPWSPLFNDYKRPLVELLRAHGDPFAANIGAKDRLDWAEVTDLIERVDRQLGRVALARVILSEPMGDTALYPARDHQERRLPPGMARTYPTLKDWLDQVRDQQPLHLAPLQPDAPNVILGRLIAEGAIDELLSTNWDAIIELGVALAGLRVEDAHEPERDADCWWTRLPQRMRVFETQDELVARWPPHGQPALYKLHGGVRTLYRVLDMGPTDARDQALRRSFFLSASDLARWQGATQWVDERVSAVLRSCATLFIGVSGADPVTFHATRAQLTAWEDAACRLYLQGQTPWPSRVAGVDWGSKEPKDGPGLRLRNMLTAACPDGRLIENVAQSGVPLTLHALYAVWLLDTLADAAPDQKALVDRIRVRLLAELDAERDAEIGLTSRVVVHSLGQGARWTAEALGVGPFQVQSPAAEPFRRWWYSPWRDAPPAALRPCAEAVIRWLARLLEGAEEIEQVDPWTGILLLRSGDRRRAVLPLPCPWTDRFDWSGDGIADALSARRFGWAAGQHQEALACAPLELVPLGGGDVTGPAPRLAGHLCNWRLM